MDEKVHLSPRTIIKLALECYVLDRIGDNNSHYSTDLLPSRHPKTDGRKFADSDDRKIKLKISFYLAIYAIYGAHDLSGRL